MNSKWTEADMQAAISAVQNGTLAIKKAATQYGVHKKALYHRLRRLNKCHHFHGKQKGIILDPERERVLVAWILAEAEAGLPAS